MIVSSLSMNPVYSPPPSVRIPFFEQLLSRLLHCCFGSTWQAQMGGVMGLGALVGKVTVETLRLFQVRIVRVLVYVLKKLPIYAIAESRRRQVSRTGSESEVSELLEHLYHPLIQPLLGQPLRSRTVDQQVGIVAALNLCLALRPPLLKLTQELINFLQEALQIAEADETVWVVAVAKEGLRQVINQQRMPKELLQNSLRLILVNLAHTKNLIMPLLQGLAGLLELLSNWFNVTLGDKLLEHLKKWLEPEKLAQSQKSWKAGEEPKIAAGNVV
ncbi:hypothetical protein Dsin_014253 [Dipteronia sinensis]|uniref:Uncharacterized protein n=1 Tax=Dipteronia sinensis TaxID=43782 RepID=A0AAE0E9N3_9ROSI|nr:hypothetical protein Dsin_014253 [Dipteronia sinensis]